MVWMGHAQLKEMFHDADKRPIAVWGLRTYTAQLANSEPDEAKSLLRTNLEAMSDEELLQAYNTFLQKKLQGSPLEDCRELERAAAPSAGSSGVNGRVRPVIHGGRYLRTLCDPSRVGSRIQAAKRSRQQAYKDVCAVWQDWAVHEPYARATNRAR